MAREPCPCSSTFTGQCVHVQPGHYTVHATCVIYMPHSPCATWTTVYIVQRGQYTVQVTWVRFLYKPGNDDGCEHGEVVAILNNVSVSIVIVNLNPKAKVFSNQPNHLVTIFY